MRPQPHRDLPPAAARAAAERRSRTGTGGFSLVELTVVVAILGVVTALAVPQYQHALETSRFTKARQELKLISIAIDTFKVSRGRLPLTLYEVGYGGRVDPWGNAYCYLNYGAGTGDGLNWALEEGIVDPDAVPNSYSDMTTWSAPAGETAASETVATGGSTSGTTASSGSGSGSSGSGSSGSGSSGSGSSGSGSSGSGSSGSGSSGSGSSGSGSSGSGSGGSLIGVAVNTVDNLLNGHTEDDERELAGTSSSTGQPVTTGTETAVDAGGSAYAYGHIKTGSGMAVVADSVASVDALLDAGLTENEAETLSDTLVDKPVFLDVDVPTVRRRNQYMFPLNTDYDLFSLGPNGLTAAALNNPTALDDVIRANNGGYFGTASDY